VAGALVPASEEAVQCRHVHDGRPARANDAPQRRERAHVVADVLEHVDQQHRVEALVRLPGAEVGLHDADVRHPVEPASHRGDRRLGKIGDDGSAAGDEVLRDGPDAGADLEERLAEEGRAEIGDPAEVVRGRVARDVQVKALIALLLDGPGRPRMDVASGGPRVERDEHGRPLSHPPADDPAIQPSPEAANVAPMPLGETGVASVPTTNGGLDPDVRLLVPDEDVSEPEVSIVIPALDEEITVGEFVDWCRQGLDAVGVAGEVLIVDSSSDRTAEIALEHGARVLKTPRRGLGRAYIDALPYVRGRYVLMGDADCTYDFRQLAPFVEKLREGNEFVMGSRWRGSIEPGSMPFLHRYLGTPVTTWILNRLYGSRFSDIHCGMRGITRDALERMDLHSQSWEYASEMILKAVHMELRRDEVPVTFHKDREGRLSHHRRSGWWSPWVAGWINLRAMFVYGSSFFMFKPGVVLFVLGLLLTLPVSFGDLDVGPVVLSLNWQFLGVALLTIGCQAFFLGCVSQILFDYTGRFRRRWLRIFPYTRTVLIAFGLVVLGIALAVPLVVQYVSSDLALEQPDTIQNHLALTGLACVLTGVQLFVFTLLLHGAVMATTRGRPAVPSR
jgi:glycosyltransferase involved in cell wall biosynthesis